jgi:hypothetical protein
LTAAFVPPMLAEGLERALAGQRAADRVQEVLAVWRK